MGVTVGKPLGDIRAFVALPILRCDRRGRRSSGDVAAADDRAGRQIADGMVFSAAAGHIAESLAVLPPGSVTTRFLHRQPHPTCISDGIAEARRCCASP
jgi:hypothetical protein